MKLKSNDGSDFVMTMTEIRTVKLILSEMITRKLLPDKQHAIVDGLLRKMNAVNMGELN